MSLCASYMVIPIWCNLNRVKNDIFNQQSWVFFQSSAFRSNCSEVFYEKVALNNFKKKICRKRPVPESFLIKLEAYKKTTADVSFCKFWNILKRISFVKHIHTTASELSQNHKISYRMMWKQEFFWLIFTFHKKKLRGKELGFHLIGIHDDHTKIRM